MLRILAAALVALVLLAGCGSEVPVLGAGSAPTATPAPVATARPTPAPATPAAATPEPGTPAPAAEPGAAADGVPALTGDPTDLTAQSQAEAGTGAPPTTLVVQDVVVGTGTPATLADTVGVRYSGSLYSDGSEFDSSWQRGDEPVEFPLDGVVPGFAQGIVGMAPGGRRVMVIPPDLGYGDQANGPIPAGSTLVFVVDLVAIS